MATVAPATRPLAPNGPQHRTQRAGLNPLALVAAAFVAGVLLAKIARIADWSAGVRAG